MLRFRRYRVFLISAVFLTIILFRLSRTNEWESTPPFDVLEHSGHGDTPVPDDAFVASRPINGQATKQVVDIEKLAHSSEPSGAPTQTGSKTYPPAQMTVEEILTPVTSTPTIPKQIPEVIHPDRKPLAAAEGFRSDSEYIDELHAQSPGKFDAVTLSPIPSSIHWVRPTERFPIPPGSKISLPTGRPKEMPKIQFTFPVESDESKSQREKRQALVKKEFSEAWNGYKTKAWMHDELRPVSGGFRDPFCGWAATLVDSLDTLWILGLKEEFENAVAAVDSIDFTTSPRSDIPLFETTIRYLGGLLAAYDVSGGKYKTLLDKAIELAEILIGAFDTPNRMPVLYYRWKPAFTSQPRRASNRANLAELGSLSMEFTRLAQLTKDSKYYDAVARVTNALEEFQNRGTKLSGIFPSEVDASGCNRTVPHVNTDLPTIPAKSNPDEVKGYEAPMPKVVQEPKPRKGTVQEPEDFELQILPGQPSKGHIETLDSSSDTSGAKRIARREENIPEPGEIDGGSTEIRYSKNAQRPAPTPTGMDWDCVPKGLTGPATGPQYFSMGGGQDSTYEYFTKQYLLLGGLEDQYRSMYIKTMDAVREHLLFRPMVPGDRDLLFSGRVQIGSSPGVKPKFDPEVTHLTCFLGGMVGMGARVFGIESDIEIAEKLSDGCVWAYEANEHGVMPELSKAIPCESASDCTWSKEMWWRWMDPLVDQREQDIREFEDNQARLKAKEDADLLVADERLIGQEKDLLPEIEANSADRITPDQASSVLNDAQDVDVDSPPPVSTRYEESLLNDPAEANSRKGSLRKRQLEAAESSSKPTIEADTHLHGISDQSVEKPSEPNQGLSDAVGATSNDHQADSGATPTVSTSSVKSKKPTGPQRPLTHEEYVTGRLGREGIPPGFSGIQSNHYILRPEAIESVWYMYRITGDPSWQDKGWRMFESIINITKSEFGHSAVKPVTGPTSPKQINEMESFWLAETLKYFYLLYSTPDVISLDEWVLNTEAHPFRRPDA